MAKKKKYLQKKKKERREKRQKQRQQNQQLHKSKKFLYEFDTETGEIYEDTKYTLFEKTIIDNFYSRLNDLSKKSELKTILREWLKGIIETNGISNTAKMLQDGASAGLIVDRAVIYDDNYRLYYMKTMIDYLSTNDKTFEKRYANYINNKYSDSFDFSIQESDLL